MYRYLFVKNNDLMIYSKFETGSSVELELRMKSMQQEIDLLRDELTDKDRYIYPIYFRFMNCLYMFEF